MVELDVQIPTTFDPFAEANEDSAAAGGKECVHIRIQQRNGKKSLTTVQGLKKESGYEKILKDLKKEFCCNGTVEQDK
ncbi:protein translation factor SUI1 homolog [Actinidia eriantha]|uniref:protein translation factor SUI1 homolog n=1 Tax=Actinidia eriantha TaxID=165200 RepID=UPI0025904CBB|nr:protein translation factor SUI1 homolog [Actinidia eriantha]